MGLEDRNKDLEDDLDDAKNKLKALERDLVGEKAKLDAKDNTPLQKILDDKDEKIDDLKRELDEKKKQLADAVDMLKKPEDADLAEIYEKQLDDVGKDLKARDDENDKLRGENDKLVGDNAD